MYFFGKTNRSYVMIDKINFLLENGKEISLGRKKTDYNIDENGNLRMYWKDCYVWDGAKASRLSDKDRQDISVAELISIEYDCDAEPDYFVALFDWG